MSLRAATRARLEESHAYSAFYRGSFANHLPMALVALDHMGASDAQIARFAERYTQAHLEPLAADSDFASQVRTLESDIACHGREHMLRESLGKLASGVGSGAFHGAIRTAYAMESQSDRELAHALAYWFAAFTPIDSSSAPGSPEAAQDLFARVSAGVAGKRPAGGGIAARMAAAARDPQFSAWCRGIPQDADVEGIAPALIGLYARTGDFTVLHAVTGCHAVRLLAPFAPDRPALARAFWVAVIAAYAGCGAPWGDENATPAPATPWADILRAAVQCEDEHDVKLTYSCWREWQHRGGEVYRHVAAATAAAGAHALHEPAS